MSETRWTPKLGLEQPAQDDLYDIEVFNANAQAIDDALGAQGGIAPLDAEGKVPLMHLPPIDAGGVKTVNGVEPDGAGDVTLGAGDVLLSDGQNVEEAMLGMRASVQMVEQAVQGVNTDPIYPLNVIAASDTIMNNIDANALTMAWKRSHDIGLVIDRMGGYGQPSDLVAVKTLGQMTPSVFENYVAADSVVSNRWFSGIDMPWFNINLASSEQWQRMKNVIMANSGMTITASHSFQPGPIGASLYHVPILAPNGMVYFLPQNAYNVLVFNPNNNSWFTFESSYRGIRSACLAPNGKIYALYPTNSGITTIDPSNNTVSNFMAPKGYDSLVLAPNGMIYCTPGSAGNIGVIDPSTNSFSTFGNVSTAGSSYPSAVLAPNGMIYCIPRVADNIGVIDPSTNTFSTFGNVAGTYNSYAYGVLAPNGMIYCIPYQATSIGVIDPSTNTFSTFGDVPQSHVYSSGVLAPNGLIYCFPNSGTTNVMVINPLDNTYITFPTLTGVNYFGGSVLAPNGKIYSPLLGANGGICVLSFPDAPFSIPDKLVLLSTWLNSH